MHKPANVSIEEARRSGKRRLLNAVFYGLATTVATYVLALASAAAQFHAAVVVLAWPSVVLMRLLPAAEPVTSDSPPALWLPLAGFALAWLTYSVALFYWLGRRRSVTGA